MRELFLEKDSLYHKLFPYLPYVTIDGKECPNRCKNLKEHICDAFPIGTEPTVCHLLLY